MTTLDDILQYRRTHARELYERLNGTDADDELAQNARMFDAVDKVLPDRFDKEDPNEHDEPDYADEIRKILGE
jgi:hypothetical protein